MNIIDVISNRISVRSFNGQSLTAEMKQQLLEAAKNSIDPFGGNVTIRLKGFDLENGYKPSTYGMIKGAREFFLLGAGDDEASALSAGFRFEQVVLKAREMGLGTCWIAATFKGSDFDKGEAWPQGEELKIISPVGFPANQSFMEKMTRMVLGSKNRKPFDSLFFTDDFRLPISPESHFGLPLEMMRLAPSSKNSQPWRALVDGNTVHFYYEPKSAASVLDTAIGMCHFYLTEAYLGRQGKFYKASNPPMALNNGKYLYSFQETARNVK